MPFMGYLGDPLEALGGGLKASRRGRVSLERFAGLPRRQLKRPEPGFQFGESGG